MDGMPGRLIVMMGLPGTGKSTLARRLAQALPAVIVDKDEVRAALFPAEEIEYSTRQDDLCFEAALSAAEFLLCKGRNVILDGRTFSHRAQVERVERFARQGGFKLCLVECTCTEETARLRLEADLREVAHPAANRSFAMYQRLKAAADPLESPHLSVDTNGELENYVARVLDYLKSDASTSPGRCGRCDTDTSTHLP
jgi:predicted kinase